MGTIDATVAGLRDIAGPAMYRDNAFRITGLPTTADRRAVRERRQQLTAAAAVGMADAVSPAQARAAFDRVLGDPRRRLVDEVFWLWGTPDGCGCPARVHTDHDAAVTAHRDALDEEQAGSPADAQWADASRLWGATLRRNRFWQHLGHRIRELDDRQLGEDTLDLLRDEVPSALLRPLVELAATAEHGRARYAALAAAWPAPAGAATDALETVAEPDFAAVASARAEAGRAVAAGTFDRLAALLDEELLAPLHRIEDLLPGHRRTAAVRDDVAITLNNCAIAVVDAHGPLAADDAGAWYEHAARLATVEGTARTVERNRAELDSVTVAFAALRAQVEHLVLAGRVREARSRLTALRAQLGCDRGGVAAIDALLATTPPPDSTGAWTRVAAAVAVGLLLVLVVVLVAALT